ncbi:plakophilin-1 [Brienomyrus brachyistius]|uniref:plakophilin-1 n=1 Tax=Brienomyrus brachyistius TaxID=42636 RepID=UPI0020B2132D|nr:plakophilin-1 [Brienomyrus brachyistius]
MTMEPFRSALSLGASEDTSLALPSDTTLRSGQRRVLDQVTTIKRSKLRQSKSGSVSPTSPQNDAVFSEFRTFRFSPVKKNSGFFLRNSSSSKSAYMQTSQARQSHSLPMGPVMRMTSCNSQSDQRFQSMYGENQPQVSNGLKPSKSDPTLVKATSATLPYRLQRASLHSTGNSSSQVVANSTAKVVSSQNRLVRTATSPLNGDSKVILTKAKTEFTGANGSGSGTDMTIKEAVEFLSSPEEKLQLCGASFIQHSTFKEDQAKQEVLRQNGIPGLVALLRNPNPQIQQTAAGALRNLVFKNADNKKEVQQCGGIEEALTLLKDTDSNETQRQLAGLLWNLSSADSLKPVLIQRALPVLTENVVVPFTCWSDTGTNRHIDPEAFCSTTGCLRNLSCTKDKERQAMRDSPGLIEALVNYIKNCVAAEKPDDMSVENCACILHNLTYQLETEAPEHLSSFSTLSATRSSSSRKTSLGCFSPQSSKVDQETAFEYPVVEEADPKGLGLLYHSNTIKTYLSLLGASQNDATLEACAGALQNLTANKGAFSKAMSQAIVQKQNGMQYIEPLLQNSSPGLQKTVVSLVGNLSRNPALMSNLAPQVVPKLATILTANANDKGNSDDTLATACRTFHALLLAEPELTKKVVNGDLVSSLNDLSRNGYLPKANKAASILLYSLWSEKDIQGFLKKQGMSKSSFVNDITSRAHKSAQVVQ